NMPLPSGDQLSSDSLSNDPTRLIAQLSKAEAVAVTASSRDGEQRLIACHGAPFRIATFKEKIAHRDLAQSVAQALSQDEPASHFFEFNQSDQSDCRHNRRALRLSLDGFRNGSGELILACQDAERPTNETILLCREIAAGFIAAHQRLAACDEKKTLWRRLGWWPRGAGWKAGILAHLQQRMIAHSRFVDRALRSIEDGLLIASVDGRITFVNPRAAAILGVSDRVLIGADIFARLGEAEWRDTTRNHRQPSGETSEILFRLLVERQSLEREIAFGDSARRHYILRISVVSERADNTGAALGIVATFSDITRQHELQQAKNDVMALVSHELRTPLTAIRAISEVLTRFEVESERRR